MESHTWSVQIRDNTGAKVLGSKVARSGSDSGWRLATEHGKDAFGDLGAGECSDVICLSRDLIGPQIEGKGHSVFNYLLRDFKLMHNCVSAYAE